MDEETFQVLCPKIKYTKPSKKVIKTTPDSNNVQKIFKPSKNGNDPGVPLTTKVAVEYLLNGKLKTSVCRYCLKVTVGLSELDQIMHIAGDGVMYKVSLREMIACFHPFKPSKEANFPDKICQTCIDRALNAYLFTQQCEQAERALYNCFDDMNEKIIKLDPVDRPKKRGRQKLKPNFNVLYAEHGNVMDYAEPIRNIINSETVSLSNEPEWNEFECKKCWQLLPDLESLLNHEQRHPKNMWYHCRICGKSFVKINQLKRHFTQVHMKGKAGKEEVDKTYKCKECGNVTENHVHHLQHIEKHKFKSIMKHLIEKKTDQLCLVCLKKSTDLVDLEKMVCIHGSCPELVGDKPLHTVLASTLPNPKSYKYQELHIPHKADIMTITERKRKYDEIQNVPHTIPGMQFKLSLPKIITRNKFKTKDFYYYVFGEPQVVDYRAITSPKIFEITNAETMDCNLDDTMQTNGHEDKSVIGHYTNEDIIKGSSAKDPVKVVRNNNSDIETLSKDNEANHRIKSSKVTNEIQVKERTQIGKNVMNAQVKPMNLSEYDHPTDGNQNSGLINSYDTDIPNVKEPTVVVGNSAPDNPEDAILIDEKYPTNLIKTNKLDDKLSVNVSESSRFHFSNPIVLDFDHNIKLGDEMVSASCDHVGKPNDQELHTSKSIKVSDIPEYDVRQMKVKTDFSWIFSKTPEKYTTVKDNEVTDKVTTAKPKVNDGECKFCWIFKTLNKCEYCKKPIVTGVKITDKDKQNTDKNIVIDNKDIENPTEIATFSHDNIKIKTKPVEIKKYDKKSRIETWQCNICLTNNNKDRSTCHCCDSQKYIENGECKVKFGSNKNFFINTLGKENKKESNMEKDVHTSNKDTTPFLVMDDATMMDTIQEKSGTMQEVQIDNIKDTNSPHSMDIETNSVNYDFDTKATINEEMEVEEEPLIPNTIQKFDPTPANTVVTNIMPFVGANIQFNIGSISKQNEKPARKIKRAFRHLPKAFHK